VALAAVAGQQAGDLSSVAREASEDTSCAGRPGEAGGREKKPGSVSGIGAEVRGAYLWDQGRKQEA